MHENTELNSIRYRNSEANLQQALGELSGVMGGRTKNTDKDFVSENPLVKACEAVARHLSMSITLTRSLKDGKFSSDPVGDVAAASHFRTRDIMLTEQWYTQNSGAFFAFTADAKEPVALLPTGEHSYQLYNPKDDSYVKVDKTIAGTLNPKAKMFYRNLPAKVLTIKEILKFVFVGTGKKDWIWVLAMGFLGGIFGMVMPQVTGQFFETVIPNGNKPLIFQLGFLMVAVTFATFAFEITRSFAVQRISGIVERDLQSAVWDRLLSLPVSFFKEYSSGELAQRAMSVSSIRQVLSGALVNTIISAVFSFCYIIMMFVKGGSLAWGGLAIIAVTIGVSIGFGYLQTKYDSKLIDVNNKLSGRMFGWLSGLAKIKMSGAEKRTFLNWANDFSEARRLTRRKENIGNYSAIVNSVVSLLSSVIIFSGMYMSTKNSGSISIGTFLAFNAAFSSLTGVCMQLAGTFLQINVIKPLWKKVEPIFLAVPEYDEQKLDPGELNGDIELSHVHFRYNPDGDEIIKDVSLSIKAGEHIALVGPSGSGKSTLFRILLGFEKPQSGSIYFDGVNEDELDIRLVRKQLGVVLQSGQLLAGSIFDNIVGSNSELTQADAMLAIEKAGMTEDLEMMPMGLHTVVSEGAGTVSGGQRQRLLIARALASNPKIMFFDEATSALDNKTQKIVTDSINALNATRITIAHRLSTIQDCDRIVVLEHGVLTEQGTYDELMKLGGTFAKMAQRQLA
jgi:ATP-binding cassette subfamily C protein